MDKADRTIFAPSYYFIDGEKDTKIQSVVIHYQLSATERVDW